MNRVTSKYKANFCKQLSKISIKFYVTDFTELFTLESLTLFKKKFFIGK